MKIKLYIMSFYLKIIYIYIPKTKYLVVLTDYNNICSQFQ